MFVERELKIRKIRKNKKMHLLEMLMCFRS